MKAIIVILDILRQVERLHICGGKKRFYILEQKDMLALGQLRQLPHHDACTHMEPPYTTRSISQKGAQYHTGEYSLQVVGECGSELRRN